jgi:uncharacterized membrane protein YozB (DUF420 family)
MILITLQYIPIDFDVAFLRIKQDIIGLKHYQIAFFTHVYTSIFVLLLGLFQFSASLRKNFPTIHRTIGKSYVILILLLASPSGLVIGYYANGGLISQLGFMTLAILWFVFTLMAFNYARKREFKKHRIFMLRSFALTLSAISLRLLKFGIVGLWELPPMDVTRIIAWGGWCLNLVLIELYIRSSLKSTRVNY